MNKIEKAAVVILVTLLVGWGFFQRKYMQPQPAPAMGGTNTTSIVSNALPQTTGDGDGAPDATVTTPDVPALTTFVDAGVNIMGMVFDED